MTLERAIEILEAYNLYRTGKSYQKAFTFDQTTEAIDTVLKHLKK